MPTIEQIVEKYKDIDRQVICAEYLEELLCAAREQQVLPVGKKVILVVGMTGAGKSTLIKYLQGYRYEQYEDDAGDKLVLERAPENPPLSSPIVGHDGSCTLLPANYPIPENPPLSSPIVGHDGSCTLLPANYPINADTYVCDTAGLGDSRGETERVFAFIVLQMIVRVTAIKGIICVAEEASLSATRYTGFVKIANILHSIIRDRTARNAIFLITNRGTKNKEQLLASCAKLIRRSDVEADAKEIIEMFSATGNVISNIDMNRPEGRTFIMSQFYNTSIDSSYLSITNTDAMDQNIRQIIETVILRVNALLDERDNAIRERYRKTAELNREEQLLATSTSDVERYQRMIDSDNELMTHADVERIVQERDRYKNELTNAKSAVTRKNEEIERTNQQLNSAKANTTEVVIHSATWNEKAILGEQKKGTVNRHKFYYNSGDVPISDIQTQGAIQANEGDYGAWSGKAVNGSVAEIIYSTPSHVYGTASFQCLAQKRFTATGKADINNIEESLRRKKQELDVLTNERNNAEERYNDANQIALNAMTNTRETLRDTIAQLERVILRTREQVNALTDDIRRNGAIKIEREVMLQQAELKSRVKMVHDIYCIMQIQDERIRLFIQRCMELQTYRNTLVNPMVAISNTSSNTTSPPIIFSNVDGAAPPTTSANQNTTYHATARTGEPMNSRPHMQNN